RRTHDRAAPRYGAPDLDGAHRAGDHGRHDRLAAGRHRRIRHRRLRAARGASVPVLHAHLRREAARSTVRGRRRGSAPRHGVRLIMELTEMRPIPAGTVTLHDARRKEHRTVRLEPFEIGVYPVTEELFAELLGVPSRHPRRPAHDLSWLRAVRFCNAASEWEGYDPAYTYDGEDVTWHTDSDGYRLPTEAEWEYACR